VLYLPVEVSGLATGTGGGVTLGVYVAVANCPKLSAIWYVIGVAELAKPFTGVNTIEVPESE
jgi:hypothetical protein